MAKAFGDEFGLLWKKEVYVGKTASKKTDAFKGSPLPTPTDYVVPEYRSIIGRPRIALDIETYDPNLLTKGAGVYRKDGYILGVAIDYDDGDRRYYPLRHSTGDNLNETAFLETLAKEAPHFKGILVNANLQYDLDWLSSYGVNFVSCRFFDVQFAEALLDEEKLKYSLDILARQYLGIGKFTSRLEEHYGENFITYLKDIHPCYVSEYANGDVYLPLEIMDRQLVKLHEEGLDQICDLEHRLLPMLLQMRKIGVRIDLDSAERAKEACDTEALEIGQQIKAIAGFDVEINAAESIARAFDKLQLPYNRTKKGAPSFQRKWLESHNAPIARLITNRRKLEKVSGTFLRNYILQGNVNGRIHCMFNPLRNDEGGTVSGRFSSSYPNLQNIPARDKKLGPLCRSAFIPEEACRWGRIDWSQIEYRFLVHYAIAAKIQGAELTAQMYREDKGTDFHEMAASITGKDREVAKSINFGVVYGMGRATMAANLGTSPEDAAPVLKEFHNRMPWLKKLYNLTDDTAKERGYIRTILGRRRRFNNWEKTDNDGRRVYLSDNSFKQLSDKDKRGYKRANTHKALNALLQGSAADLMKKSMVEAHEAGIFKTLYPHLTVHDELNTSIPQSKEGDEAFKELIHVMETTVPLHVPVLADAKTGDNWSKCK